MSNLQNVVRHCPTKTSEISPTEDAADEDAHMLSVWREHGSVPFHKPSV